MLIGQTKEKLNQLKLTAFSEVLDEITGNTSVTLSITEARGLMVDRELTARKNRKLTRLLRQAKLRYPTACMEGIDYQLPRKFNDQQVRQLVDCDWVAHHRNIIFNGPTGVGKSYLACALGYKACQMQYNVRYFRTTRLLESVKIAHGDGSYAKMLASLEKIDVLILDDWGIDQLSRQARKDLLEIVEDRYQRQSTIITTQLPVEHWHDYIGDNTLADAICDRLLTAAYTIEMTGESVRKQNNDLTHVDQ